MKETDRGRVVAGRYELDKLLGQGGMGEVWVANDRATGSKIALKLLKVEAAASKEQRGRFEREARIAGTLVSPHITRVTDSGVDEDGAPFMALELLEGEDLQKRIKTEKVLPIAYVVRLAIQVGRALHVAHAAGLVHRDLKPANIFLSQQSGEEIAKVLDFGIAKGAAESNEFTTAGEMLGTASYMSPEQIRNAKTVTHQADLWALAVVLFRALTGEFPFVETGFDLFLALTQDPLPAPRQITSLVPTLPPPLNVFFERAFTRDVARRYPNASAMVVGFCRAAGVTVPPDILSAADSPAPSRAVSGQYPAVSQHLSAPPISGQPISGQPISGPTPSGQYPSVPQHLSAPPISGRTPSGQYPSASQHLSAPPISPQTGRGPLPSAPSHEPPAADEGVGLSGTLMLDSVPDLAPDARSPAPAAGRPAEPPSDMLEIDPDEPDNAATLFYQPGLKVPMDIRPGAPPPSPVFSPPPEPPRAPTPSAADLQVRMDAPSGHPSGAPRPALRGNRGAGLWILLVVIVLLAGAAVAVLFFMKG